MIRAIGRWSLVALVLNGIIGSAIFGLPSAIAKLVGSSAPWAYVGGALGIGVIMAVFAELSSQFRETGGQYRYARETLGRFVGIQTGWFVWLVRLTSGAAVLNLLVVYLGEFFPGVTAPLPRALVMTGLVAAFATVNLLGVRAGAGLSNFFTVAKLVPLVAFIGVGLWLVPSPTAAAAPASVVPSAGAWLEALVAMMFAYGGFESAVIPAAETKNPRRDTPFALLFGLVIVATCYLLAHLVAMWALPDLATSTRPLADAARTFAGPAGAQAITIGALISMIGWMSAAFVTVPRLTFALAEAGDFPRMFGSIHPRFRTPHVSILLWAALLLILALSGSFIWNAILSGSARLVTFFATCAALIKLRRTHPEADAWRAPAGDFLALLGFAFCGLLFFRLTLSHAAVVGVVGTIATINWLVVRRKSPTHPTSPSAG